MAILNNVEHAALRYQPAFGSNFGDCVNSMQLFPSEYDAAQRDHPILFKSGHDGGLMSIALLGLEKGENLHFNGHDWGQSYIPATHRRGPFALQVQKDAAGADVELMVVVDLDDPRLGKDIGEPLFKPHGGNSLTLDAISQTLLTIIEGTETQHSFAETLQQANLLSPVLIEADLGNGTSVAIADHWVISAEAFQNLDGAQLSHLNNSGFLVPIVQAMMSVGNIQRLIDRKVMHAITA